MSRSRVTESATKRLYGSRRPRRTAARHADRDDAPRRLRAAVSRPKVLFGTRRARQAARADRGGRHRRRRGVFRHGGAEASERKAEMTRHAPLGRRPPRLCFYAPTRGLIGYQGEFLTDTRGTGIMNRLFHEYAPLQGPDPGPPQRRADLDRSRRSGGLCLVEPGGSRADDDRAGRSACIAA